MEFFLRNSVWSVNLSEGRNKIFRKEPYVIDPSDKQTVNFIFIISREFSEIFIEFKKISSLSFSAYMD